MIFPGVVWDWVNEGRRGGLREDTGDTVEDIVVTSETKDSTYGARLIVTAELSLDKIKKIKSRWR